MNEVLPAPTPIQEKTAHEKTARERTMSRMKQLASVAAMASAATPAACHPTAHDAADASADHDAQAASAAPPVDAGPPLTLTLDAFGRTNTTSPNADGTDAGTRTDADADAGTKVRIVRPVSTPRGYTVVDPMPRPIRRDGGRDGG